MHKVLSRRGEWLSKVGLNKMEKLMAFSKRDFPLLLHVACWKALTSGCCDGESRRHFAGVKIVPYASKCWGLFLLSSTELASGPTSAIP